MPQLHHDMNIIYALHRNRRHMPGIIYRINKNLRIIYLLHKPAYMQSHYLVYPLKRVIITASKIIFSNDN